MDHRDGLPHPGFFYWMNMTETPMNGKTYNVATTPTGSKSIARRLPCRGCTRQCNNYRFCNGKPWRK
jgi:hypothetical protein